VRRLALIVAMTGCSPGFEIDAHVGANAATLSQNGTPISSFEVDRTFDSFAAAEAAPVTFEVYDDAGGHEFDLRQYFDCGPEVGTPTYESVDLELSDTDCPALVVVPATQLGLCWERQRCTGTDGSSDEIP
jgi:hypothetical protein